MTRSGRILQTKLDKLANILPQMDAVTEKDIERGLVPTDQVDDLRTLMDDYVAWVASERKETSEFLDCMALDQAAAIPCLQASAATTTRAGDQIAQRIIGLQEKLYGITATPSTVG